MFKRIIFILLSILIIIFYFSSCALAENLYDQQFLSINQLKIEIHLSRDGQLQNKEEIEFNYLPNFPFIWPIYSSHLSEVQIKNGETIINPENFEIIKQNANLTYLLIKEAPENSLSWQINYKVKHKINYYSNYDELHWIVAYQNGAEIRKAKVSIQADFDLSKSEQKIYSYGLESKSYNKEGDKLIYKATGIEPTGNFTIVALIPKNLLNPSLITKILTKISRLDFWAGILICILQVVIAWLIFKLLSLRQTKKITPPHKEYLESPPNDIPAAIVGVLINKKINYREIAATIIELAQRGFLTLLKEGNTIFFLQRKPFDETKPAEKAIIEEIFNPEENQTKISMNLDNLKSAEKQKLSSKKISSASEHIYKIIEALGYFKTNPHKLYLKYFRLSIIFLFISLIGIIFSIPFIYSYPILIFIFIGFAFISFIIPQKIFDLAIYTKRGREVARNWLLHKNYLSRYKSPKNTDYDKFLKYLPYAIVLGVEKKWADQFEPNAFKIPPWLDIGYTSYDLNNFINETLPLIFNITYTFIEAREPLAR